MTSPKLLSVLGSRKHKEGVPLSTRIEQMSMPVPFSGCWIWLGSGNRLGYGGIKVEGKMRAAHRVSYEVFNGPIPVDTQVHHSCDVSCCVNPQHLTLGSAKENAASRSLRGRHRNSWSKTASVQRSASIRFDRLTPQGRIEALSMPITECGCWLFLGATRNGYGRLKNHRTGATESVHRLSWEAYRGPIPSGMHVLHRCDVPGCVNPDHLFLGTHKQNMADRRAKRRCASYVGEVHPRTHLKDGDVRTIRALEAGHRIIAERFDISVAAVRAIKYRRTWRHLP